MLGPAPRLILEAAFLVALAVAAGLAEFSSGQIIGVMALGWALTALVELVAWNIGARRATRRDATVVVGAASVAHVPTPAPPGPPSEADAPADENKGADDAASPDVASVEPLRPSPADSREDEGLAAGESAPAGEAPESTAGGPGSEGDEDPPADPPRADMRSAEPEGGAEARAGQSDAAVGPGATVVSPAHDERAPEGRRRWFRRGQRGETGEPAARPLPRHVRLITRQDEPDADTDEHVLAPPEQRAGEG